MANQQKSIIILTEVKKKPVMFEESHEPQDTSEKHRVTPTLARNHEDLKPSGRQPRSGLEESSMLSADFNPTTPRWRWWSGPKQTEPTHRNTSGAQLLNPSRTMTKTHSKTMKKCHSGNVPDQNSFHLTVWSWSEWARETQAALLYL